jgi:HlyD family secretion protein
VGWQAGVVVDDRRRALFAHNVSRRRGLFHEIGKKIMDSANIQDVMTDKLSHDLRSLRIDRTRKEGDRSSRKWLIVGLLAMVALAVAGAVAFMPDTARISGLSTKAREVEVAMVVRQSPTAGSVLLTAGGYIIPRRRVEVSSKTSGRVEELLVDKGDKVVGGQVLARLDDREIRAQLEQVRAIQKASQARLNEALAGSRPQEIQRAQAAVEQAEANMRTAQVTLDRAKQLNRSGVFAKQALDDAQNAYDVMVAQAKVARENHDLARLGPRQEQIDLARAQLAESEAQIRWLEAQLENYVIRAPLSGTILERLIEKGEMVTTGFVSGRGAKAALVSIANLKELEVELDINESDIPRVHLNQECTVSPDSYPDRKYKAKVREIAPEANRQKATIQVKVAISDPDEYLRPETNAKVNFLEEGKEGNDSQATRILVPKSAVVSGPAVFLLKNGKAVKQSIKTGKELWGQVEIASGLDGGEQIIIRGIDGLVEGEKVALKK